MKTFYEYLNEASDKKENVKKAKAIMSELLDYFKGNQALKFEKPRDESSIYPNGGSFISFLGKPKPDTPFLSVTVNNSIYVELSFYHSTKKGNSLKFDIDTNISEVVSKCKLRLDNNIRDELFKANPKDLPSSDTIKKKIKNF